MKMINSFFLLLIFTCFFSFCSTQDTVESLLNEVTNLSMIKATGDYDSKIISSQNNYLVFYYFSSTDEINVQASSLIRNMP